MINTDKVHYKDCLPSETVRNLINKLYQLDMKVTEKWQEDEEIGTNSLRLNFAGTKIGCNGKGIDREYARASAYGELFERYQNNMLCDMSDNMKSYSKTEYGFELAPDEKLMTAEELLDQGDEFHKYVCNSFKINDTSQDEFVKLLRKIGRPDRNGKILSLPFYSLQKKQIIFLPYSLYMRLYGSNGMAAGNTPEEGIVQALAEIMERVVQEKVILEGISFPTIPTEIVKRYPHVFEMYKKVKEMDDYYIEIKDCSLDGKYPVAALYLIEKNTGKYGIKFGCHPNMGVAMERAFTEAAQGHSILKYSKRSVFDFENKDVSLRDNIENSFLAGQAQYDYKVFADSSDFEFNDFCSRNISNAEMCNIWLSKLINDGYDVLIRDASVLGFPTYQILVPGLSEVVRDSVDEMNNGMLFDYVNHLLEHPEEINYKNCKYIISSLDYYSRNLFTNRVKKYYKGDIIGRIPYENISCDGIYLSAMCHVLLNDFSEAYKKINYMIEAKDFGLLQQDEQIMLRAIHMYISGRAKKLEHVNVMEYISKFYSNEINERIDEIFINTKNVILKQYPVFRNQIDEKRLDEDRIRLSITKKFREQQIANNINQLDFGEKVEEYVQERSL